MKVYVLVYGSLKRAYWNNRILEDSVYIGEGITISDTFSMFDGGYPYVTMNGLSKIKGEVFEVINPRILSNLDSLEGVPSHYVRTAVDVKVRTELPGLDSIEEVYECFMYVASRQTMDHLTTRRLDSRLSPDADNVLSWKEEKA